MSYTANLQRLRRRWRAGTFGCLAVAATVGSACGDSGSASTAGSGASASTSSTAAGSGGEASWLISTGSGSCDSQLYAPPIGVSRHVETCSVIDWQSTPPTSGDHYGKWAAFKTYDKPVPRGFYLHAMEHGAIVLAYKGQADVGAMQELVDALPEDAACADGVRARAVITEDPTLDVPFAAIAWGQMLKADCFDATLVEAFITEHYAKGPEDLCAPGFDPTATDSGIPEDCGT